MSLDKYNQLLKDYVNTSYNDLLRIAENSMLKIMPAFNSIAKDGNGASLILPFICTALASDGKFTELEYKFVKQLINSNLSYDQFKNVVQQYYSAEWLEAIDKLYDALPTNLKGDLLSFCLCFVAVDETITREENAFIAKLLV